MGDPQDSLPVTYNIICMHPSMMNHRTGPHLNTLGQVVVEQFYLLQYTLIVSKGHADRLAFWQSWVCFEASKDSEKEGASCL